MFPDKPFSKLLAPHTIERFFQSYWQKKFLLIQRNKTDYFDSILKLNDLDIFFQNKQVPATYLKVMKRDELYLPEEWSRLDVRREFHPQHIVDQDRLFSLFNQGASFMISGGHKSIPRLTEFCIKLEQELQLLIQANIYVTPPHAQGLGAHYDAHDVLILQISGYKQWRLYDMPVIKPTPAVQRFDKSQYEQTEPKHQFTLNAGDLLYIPRGLVHDATTEGQASSHITLGMLPRYGYDLFDSLRDTAQQDPDFRCPLPHAYSSDSEIQSFAHEFKQRLKHLIQTTPLESLLHQQQREFTKKRLRSHQGKLVDVMLINQLNSDSVVQKREDIDCVIKRDNKEISIKWISQELILPHYLESTLANLLEDKPFTISAIQGLLTKQGKIDLVKEFVKSGLLRIIHV